MNRSRLFARFSIRLVSLALIAVACPVGAIAGEMSYAYQQDGTEPGTVWITVSMDPVDWGPCDECLMPDWSEVHVSPAPLQPEPWSGSSYPGGSISFDETGAFLRGDGFVRTLILDVGTTYELTGAITRRSAMEVEVLHDGTRQCVGGLGCLHEVTDYPALTVDPLVVEVEEGSLSVIKGRYSD